MAHIVHVVGTLGAGGVQRLVLSLAGTEPLSQHHHSVICVFGAQGSFSEEFRKMRVSTYDCPFPWPRHFGYFPYRVVRWFRHSLTGTFPFRLARQIRRIGADLVHTHVTSRMDLQAKGIIDVARKPWVWTVHGLYRPEPVALAQWQRALRVCSFGRARVTSVAAAIADDLCGRTGFPRTSVSVCHSGVELQTFFNVRPGEGSFRKRFAVPSEAIVFGSVGRLVEEKAYDTLIEAASLLRQWSAHSHFLVAGEGRDRAKLEGLISAKGLKGLFHLVGNCQEVPRFLSNIDVFVLPSRREGFPIALVEALAASLPCVATNVGGIPEILDSGSGILVEPESPAALARALESMLDSGTRAGLPARASSCVARFSIDHCARQYSEIYESLTDAPKLDCRTSTSE
jgi:glycosyltransferase involved in cell wall biosynthesis